MKPSVITICGLIAAKVAWHLQSSVIQLILGLLYANVFFLFDDFNRIWPSFVHLWPRAIGLIQNAGPGIHEFQLLHRNSYEFSSFI